MHDVLGQHSHWRQGEETLQEQRQWFSYTLESTKVTHLIHGCLARHACVRACVGRMNGQV